MPKNESRHQWLAVLARMIGAPPWAQGTELIEIRKAILDDAAEKIVAVGDGKRIFPFNHLRLHLWAKTEDQRVVTVAAVEAWNLPSEIRKRLGQEHCEATDLTLELVMETNRTAAFREQSFFLEYQRVQRQTAAAEPPELTLTILKGTAAQQAYRFRQLAVLIGRQELVVNENGAPVRHNDLAFLDKTENETVSREHARIDYHPAEGYYTLTDQRSSSGTYVFRGSRRITVPSRDKRGIRLQSGDLLYFGLAEVKCELEGAPRLKGQEAS